MMSKRILYGFWLMMMCVMVSTAFAVETPQQFTAYSNGDSVYLRWQPALNAFQYFIYKDVNFNVDRGFPYATLSPTQTSFTDSVDHGNAKYFYVVTADVKTCLQGTVTDNSGKPEAPEEQENGYPIIWISGHSLTDSVGTTFQGRVLSNGTFVICDIAPGTYRVHAYKKFRPLLTTTLTIPEGTTQIWNPTWSPFDYTEVEGHLDGTPGKDTVWTNDKVWRMTSYCWVDSLKTIYVQEGTTIVGTLVAHGDSTGNTFSMLVIRPGGKANIIGEKYAPVVFTSGKPYGTRGSGDWGGITICGLAHNNRTNGLWTTPYPVWPTGEGAVGPAGRPDTLYDYMSSGIYRYCRLEWSGFRFNDVNELNGFAWYGVGRGTQVSYLESTCSKDDQMEFFGGEFNCHHLVLTQSGDDGYDWTDGWSGTSQFVVIQVRAFESGHGIEADNYENGYDFLPRSNPKLANFTIISSRGAFTGAMPNDADAGVMLRRGTLFNIHNFVVTLGRYSGVDLDDSSTAWQVSQANGPNYWDRTIDRSKSCFDNSIFWNNGQDISSSIDTSTHDPNIADGHFWVEDAEWDLVNCRPTRQMCVNSTTLCAPVGWTQNLPNYRGCGFVGNNTTNVIADPMLYNPTAVTGNPGTPGSFDPRPQLGSPCLNPANAATELPEGLAVVPYVGAFSGPTDNWMEGWTRFLAFYEY